MSLVNVLSSRSSDSVTSVVEKGWGLITTNTEILSYMVCGVITTMVDIAGYWPRMQFTQLFPEDAESDFLDGFKKWLYILSEGVEIVRFYSIHVYLATYILLPYTLLTEKQKVLLTPWLLCGVLRSIFLNLLIALAGILLCACHNRFHYPCFRYSIFYAAEFCCAVFVWASVHAFYHYLDKKSSEGSIAKVIKTIHKAGARKTSEDSSLKSPDISISHIEDDDDDNRSLGSEASLVERAAMAWIAREILENGAEYVSDSQFSDYLSIKATMELRQIIKELAERKGSYPRKRGSSRQRHKRLEDAMSMQDQGSSLTLQQRLPSKLELTGGLSHRDPILKIPPLTSFARPVVEGGNGLTQKDVRNTRLRPTYKSLARESVKSQTDPVTPELARLMDNIEEQQEKESNQVKILEVSKSEHTELDNSTEVDQNNEAVKKGGNDEKPRN